MDYNVNYLYACDKMVKPVLLAAQGSKWSSDIVRREGFRERLYRSSNVAGKIYDKITGRNLLMLQIDSIAQDDKMVTITGWCVQRNRDNVRLSKNIWLVEETKKTGVGTIYAFDLPSKLREDVAELFAEDKSTENVALSGISLLFAKQGLRYGKYRIAVLINGKHLLYMRDQTGNLVFIKIDGNSQ